MNFSADIVVLVIFIASCFVSESEGRQCYVCQLCDNPFHANGVYTVDCQGSCVKSRSSRGILRACSPMKEDDMCYSSTEKDVNDESCFCNRDLCNGGSVRIFSVIMILMMFTVLSLLKFIY